MGLFSYSEKEANKIIARALVDFMGGSNEVSSYIGKNEDVIKLLKKKNFFAISGLGSLEALDESSQDELAASFRAGCKYNDFNEFFHFCSNFSPKFSVGEDIGETYLNRYNDLVEKVITKKKKRKNYEENKQKFELKPSDVNKKLLLESFNSSLLDEGYMGGFLKSNKDVSASDAVALLVSANKIITYYQENENSVNHYLNVIQKLMFEEEIKEVEKTVEEQPLKEEAPEAKPEIKEKTAHVADIFAGVKPLEDGSHSNNKKETKEQTAKTEEKPKVTTIKEKSVEKSIKPFVIDELEEMGIDTKALKEFITKEEVVKYFLTRKNKASLEDIKGIINTDETIRSIVLTPVFKTFLGVNNIKNTFDPRELSEYQIELFCKIADVEKTDFSTIMTRMENFSIVLKNLFNTSLKEVQNAGKIKNALINEIVSSNALTKKTNEDFLSEVFSLVFEPKVLKSFNKNIYLPENIASEVLPKKIFVEGYVRTGGEVIKVDNIPVSMIKTKNGEFKYDYTKASFTSLEIEKFKDDLKHTYGCNVDTFEPSKDVIIGNSDFLNFIHRASSQNQSDKMAKINDSPLTKQFINDEKYYNKEELEKVYSQVDVKNEDYTIFKNMAFYKNAKEKAFNKAQKDYYERKKLENDKKLAEEQAEAEAKAEEQAKAQARANAQSKEQPKSQSQTEQKPQPKSQAEEIFEKEQAKAQARADAQSKSQSQTDQKTQPKSQDEEIFDEAQAKAQERAKTRAEGMTRDLFSHGDMDSNKSQIFQTPVKPFSTENRKDSKGNTPESEKTKSVESSISENTTKNDDNFNNKEMDMVASFKNLLSCKLLNNKNMSSQDKNVEFKSINKIKTAKELREYTLLTPSYISYEDPLVLEINKFCEQEIKQNHEPEQPSFL